MFPTSFKQSNAVLEPPEGMPPDITDSISVCRATTVTIKHQAPVVLSCWKLTQEELDEINKTKRVWLHVMGESMPPVWLSGKDPFEDK